ncbi:MAG: cytochrome c biogenesis protein CcdA [Armatimonadota bacterium]|nr:cytochrome c biogenesis protein CcdA [Armatimonadota bacterium]
MENLFSLVPWAFSAGMVATLNPCGFAMLPAYLTYFVGRTGNDSNVPGDVLRGVGVGLGMTTGVLTVFLLTGALISAAGVAMTRYIPWLGLVIGAVVVGAGAAMLVRPRWQIGLAVPNPAERRSSVMRARGYRAFYLFGAGYGLASLGCTLPVFLIVTTQALAAGGFVPGLVVFLTYGLGMGLVLLALSTAAGIGRGLLAQSLRALVPCVRWAGGFGMVAAGAYLIYYQFTTSRILPGLGS